MASSSQSQLAAALNDAASKPTSTRTQAYQEILVSLLEQPRSSLSAEALVQACSDYLDTTVFSDLNSSGGGLVVGRNTLTAFDEAIKKAGHAPAEAMQGDDEQAKPAIQDEEVQKDILEAALAKVQPRVLSFEEQSTSLRLHLADIHESLEDWSAAATVLQGIPLDSGHRSVSDLQKLSIYVRIVRLLLEADDAVGADVYLKRASMVIHLVPGARRAGPAAASSSSTTASPEDVKQGKLLSLQYKLCQARIYDSQRRFADAAVRYHELSYIAEIDEQERTMMLSSAVNAAILAPAGPHRSRILSTLVRDERVAALPQATILSKVFLDQIVRPDEVAAFEEFLQPHQKAKLARTTNEREVMRLEEEAAAASADASGPSSSSTVAVKTAPTTVPDRAMMEHNVLASSRLYLNITLAGLGSLLGLTATGAELIVRRMIGQGRIKAEIDQVDGLLTFLESNQAEPTAGGLGVGAEASGGGDAVAVEEDEATPVGEGDGLIRRWDARIARTAGALEEVCSRIASTTSSTAAAAPTAQA